MVQWRRDSIRLRIVIGMSISYIQHAIALDAIQSRQIGAVECAAFKALQVDVGQVHLPRLGEHRRRSGGEVMLIAADPPVNELPNSGPFASSYVSIWYNMQ